MIQNFTTRWQLPKDFLTTVATLWGTKWVENKQRVIHKPRGQ